jgi:radical SAM protein with 4Fe4S-binding SPASM domain
MTQNTICALPWVHLNIIPNGKVYHCCMTTDYKTFAGDLNTQTIEEVWNGDFMKNLRKQMINGEEPKACSKCFESERSSGTSTRLNHNKFYKSKLNEIPIITEASGHVDKVDLKYWDFRFSNLCNYKCRTCGPDFSSAWIPDAEKMGWKVNEENKKVLEIKSVNQQTNLDFVKKYINTVEKIYFAGGEPLLMDEHWQILDMLDQAQRYNVILTYNSNLSKLVYKDKNVLDYWRKWGRRIWLWPSIDEIDERSELIRSGTNWPNVEANLKAAVGLKIHIKPSITVSIMNVFRIPEIIQRMIDIGVIRQEDENWNNFHLNVVEYSERFRVGIMNDTFKAKTRKKLEDFIVTYKEKYGVDIKDKFLHLFWHLEKPSDLHLIEDFKVFTNYMDELRNENTWETIPELKEAF